MVANNKGFGLIEIMIGAALLMIAIIGALFISGINATTASDNPISISMQIVRSTVLNSLQNDQAWQQTVADPANVNLSCLRSQSDCFSGAPASGAIKLKDAGGGIIYDGTQASSGFTIQGENCNTFSALDGNASCPIHLNLSWEALCNASPCVNPPVRLTGTFDVKFNAKRSTVLNMSRFNFVVFRRKLYCPAVPASWSLVSRLAPVLCQPDYARGTTVGTFSGGTCATPGDLDACDSQTLSFNYDITLTGTASMADASNRAIACILKSTDDPVTGTCLYEWRMAQGNWSLFQQGVAVYTAPTTELVNNSMKFEFYLNSGTATVYLNGARRHIFSLIYRLPMRVSFKPGSPDTSAAGFNNIKLIKR